MVVSIYYFGLLTNVTGVHLHGPGAPTSMPPFWLCFDGGRHDRTRCDDDDDELVYASILYEELVELLAERLEREHGSDH
jgi:hypothetical protein